MKDRDRRAFFSTGVTRRNNCREKLVANLAGDNPLAQEELRLLLQSRKTPLIVEKPRG